ncbi:MAG: hypothetical protein ACI4NG_04975 [Candidatus Gallimonas sp.]
MKEKKIKRYDFTKKPRRASGILTRFARAVLVPMKLKGRRLTINRLGMEGIKPPYLLLATHASMMDFYVMFKATAPYRANNVVAIDAVRDVGDGIMRIMGCICKRKFVKDLNLIRNMRYAAEKYGDIVCVYPEARYSLDGCESFLPDSVGKMCRLMGIPVVVLRMYGNFVMSPQWNKEEQYLPLRADLELVATAEETRALTVSELNGRIRAAFRRDDFAYQAENGYEIDNPKRAKGLHSILYQCPHCKKEFGMYSEGTRIWCSACGKSWGMSALGELSAEEGETEFSHIPDWFRWERENVRREVREGRYRFEDEVTVHTLPNAKRFYDQGRGKLVQTCEETRLECTAYGKPLVLEWAGTELESVHVEYDYPFRKEKYKKNLFGDCVDLSTPDESYWLHPVHLRDQLTKLSFATEEIYALAQEKVHAARREETEREKTEGASSRGEE